MLGGDSALSAGTIHAPGTVLQEEQGYGGDTTEEYIEYMKNPESQYLTNSQPLCTALYDGAREMVNDLSSKGLGFLPIPDYDIRAHNVDGGGGALMMFLEDMLDQTDVEVLTDTPAQSLILEDDNVVGVVDENGVQYRGVVILATGGFTHSSELVNEYTPEFNDIKVLCSEGSEGDGLAIAEGANAAEWNLDEGMHTYFISTENAADMSVPPSSAPGIIVNINGDRFHNEDAHYDVAGKAGIEQPEHRAYYIFDETIRRDYDIFEDYFDSGIVIEGDSLQELAKTINTPNLVTTVEHYNQMMERGVDEDFGRQSLLAPIPGPTYYAMSIEPCIYYSYGGLEIDDGSHVLDGNGAPISGLYACGELCASSELKEGLQYTSGISQGYVFGRRAVDSAIKEGLV